MLVQTKSLSFSYPGQETLTFPDISLSAGESLLVLGKSGSGKTTFLNLLSGLLPPKHGQVILDGTILSDLRGQRLDQFRASHLGIVFQKPHLIAALSVKENLEIARYFVKTKGNPIPSLLQELGIEDKAKASVATLSEGEAQRVSIARALVNSPKLILADEPTSSLDDEHAEIVIQLLKEQAITVGAALVIVTHDQRVKASISNVVEVKHR